MIENLDLEKLLEEELQVTHASCKNLRKDFNEKRGTYQTKICNVMDNMKLQRQVYLRGGLVGNVHKLTKNDLEKEFSSHENVIKIRTLLTKFKQCYSIYSVSRPLC